LSNALTRDENFPESGEKRGKKRWTKFRNWDAKKYLEWKLKWPWASLGQRETSFDTFRKPLKAPCKMYTYHTGDPFIILSIFIIFILLFFVSPISLFLAKVSRFPLPFLLLFHSLPPPPPPLNESFFPMKSKRRLCSGRSSISCTYYTSSLSPPFSLPRKQSSGLDGPSRDSQDIWDRLNVLLGKIPCYYHPPLSLSLSFSLPETYTAASCLGARLLQLWER
jgi:hypothetical protein